MQCRHLIPAPINRSAVGVYLIKAVSWTCVNHTCIVVTHLAVNQCYLYVWRLEHAIVSMERHANRKVCNTSIVVFQPCKMPALNV